MTIGGHQPHPFPDRSAGGYQTVARADQLLDIGRAQEAYDLLRADPETPTSGAALVALSHAADKLERYREARDAAGAATTLDPDRPSGWLLLAVALMKLDFPYDALGPARRGVALAPDHFGSHQIMARVLTDLGRFDEAQIHVSRTMALDPGGTSGWVTLARLQLTQQRWSDAEKSARTALSIDPESDEAKVLLSLAQASTGSTTKQAAAVETLVSTLRSNPDQAHVRELIIHLVKPRGLRIPWPIVALLVVSGIGGVLILVWAAHILWSWSQVPKDVKRLVWADRRAKWQVIGLLALAVAIFIGLVVVSVAVFIDLAESRPT